MKDRIATLLLAIVSCSAVAADEGRPGLPVDKALGALDQDLVFKPLTACRIVDTRVVGGPIAAGSSREFLAVASSAGANFTSQGGSNTNCGTADAGASAVLLNVTVVAPAMAGAATVYKRGDPLPAVTTMQFHAGQLLSAHVVTPIPNPLAIRDFVIHSQVAADYLVDVVGLFTVPGATNLDCIDTAIQSFTIGPNLSAFFNNPACPAGYRATTPYCFAGASGVFSKGMGFNSNTPELPTFCAWQNTTAASQSVLGGNVCCRVPGR